jgi:radical SAM protein with 4Fe4S-binding SPASM domain
MKESIELFDQIVDKVERNKIPLNAHIDLSYQCNLKCIHCYCQDLDPSFSQGEPEMSESEILRLIDELADIGSLFLTLSGGEVLLHPSFFKAARHARKRNFCLGVLTNGTLIDDRTAGLLKDLSPISVDLSIYGSDAATHDAITRRQGSFEKLVSAVGLLKNAGIRVLLKSVIMKANAHQARLIEKTALDIGADKCEVTYDVSVKNDGSSSVKDLRLSYDELIDLLADDLEPLPGASSALDRKASETLICGCGILGTYISPYGNVYPCIQLLIPMGNIRKDSFSRIWRARSELRDQLDSILTYADMPVCKECKFVGVCRKCIGAAYLETGDMRACPVNQRLILEAGYEIYCKQGGIR